MRRKIIFSLLAAAVISQACNLERVLDPSLPTTTPQGSPAPAETIAPTIEAIPLPTLTNEARIEEGDKLFFYGDWDGALREYETTLDSASEDDLQSAALLGMGRSYLAMGNVTAARESINVLLDLYPDSAQAAPGYLVLAEIQKEFEDANAVAAAYQGYLDHRPGLIDAYVQEWRGDALFSARDYEGAIAAYEAAVGASRLDDGSMVWVKIGNAYAEAGDHENAVLVYQEIYNSTLNDYLKADMDLLLGREYLELGQTATAYTYYQDAVTNYPLAFSSYAALVELVNAGQPVEEFQRGLIDYYAATVTTDNEGQQELYIVAIAAFDRYLQANAETHNDTAHYYRALSYRAIGDYELSLNEWDHMMSEHAFDTNWVEAYRQKARTQWQYLGDHQAAIQTLLGFVAATPSQEASAEFLFTAGQIARYGGFLTRSVEIWPRVAEEYPASEYAYDALFLAGISSYRLENYAGSQSLFLRAYQSSLSPDEESQSLFWMGKALQIQGDEDGARNAWEQVAALDPTGYYTERARDLLAGRLPFQSPASYSFDYDVEAEKLEAEAWMRTTFNLPADTNLSNPGALQADPRFLRGTELWNLGEWELARAEFENLRESLVTDPANSYRLANYLLELGLYRTAIFAAREVLNLAGMSDAGTLTAPKYFNRIRFGAYFSEIVLPETASEDIDPLFFYAMMRQESLFEGFVTSSAGARGLLQITPSTGEQAATLSGWPPDFTPDDLYRPLVSIRLGADYLAAQRHAYAGDLYATLAAYNAGPGPTSDWVAQSRGDTDLFLEIIDFPETYNHIQRIYELFTIYRNLYAVEAE